MSNEQTTRARLTLCPPRASSAQIDDQAKEGNLFHAKLKFVFFQRLVVFLNHLQHYMYRQSTDALLTSFHFLFFHFNNNLVYCPLKCCSCLGVEPKRAVYGCSLVTSMLFQNQKHTVTVSGALVASCYVVKNVIGGTTMNA